MNWDGFFWCVCLWWYLVNENETRVSCIVVTEHFDNEPHFLIQESVINLMLPFSYGIIALNHNNIVPKMTSMVK